MCAAHVACRPEGPGAPETRLRAGAQAPGGGDALLRQVELPSWYLCNENADSANHRTTEEPAPAAKMAQPPGRPGGRTAHKEPPPQGGGIAAPPVRAGRCTVYYADFELTNNNNTANKQGCVVCMYQERFGCLHTGVQAPGGAQAPAQRGRSSGVRNAARGCVFRSRKSEADRALL